MRIFWRRRRLDYFLVKMVENIFFSGIFLRVAFCCLCGFGKKINQQKIDMQLASSIQAFVVDDATAIEDRNAALARVIEWVSSSTPQDRLTSLVTTHLRSYLGSDGKDSDRARATLLLARVVRALIGPDSLDPNTINMSTSSFLCKFFCGRMESDYSSMQGCLEALVAITERSDLTSTTDALFMLNGLKALHVPQMAVNLRILAHELFGLLVRLDTVSSDFKTDPTRTDSLVEQFCDAMNQESDPRCLKQCFGIAKHLMVTFEAELSDSSVEKMFEVTECYVPIEFTPPPNDQRGITQDDLVNGLRDFFSCTPRMATDVVDMVRDRLELDESSAAARSDVLWTLSAALPTFCKQPDTWMETSFQSCIQSSIEHVLSGSEENVVEAALSLIHATSRSLTICPEMGPCCVSLLSVLVGEAFGDAETFRASSAIRGVVSFVTASGYSYERGMRAIVALAKKSFLSTGLPERKLGILRHLAMVASVMDKDVVYTDINNDSGSNTSTIKTTVSMPFLVRDLAEFARGPAYLHGSSSKSNRASMMFIIDILRACVVRSPVVLLPLDEVHLILELLYVILNIDTNGGECENGGIEGENGENGENGESGQSGDVGENVASPLERQRAMEALVDISEKNEDHVKHVLENMLPGLLKGALGKNSTVAIRSLETVGMLCDLPSIFDAAVPVLLESASSYVETVVQKGKRNAVVVDDKDVGFSVFRAICNLLHRNATPTETQSKLLPDMLRTLVRHSIRSSVGRGLPPILHRDIVEATRHIVRNMPRAERTTFANEVVKEVILDAQNTNDKNGKNGKTAKKEKNNDVTALVSVPETAKGRRYRSQTLALLASCVCSVGYGEEIEKMNSLKSLFLVLCDVARSSSQSTDRSVLSAAESAAQVAGSIVNKMPPGDALDAMIKEGVAYSNSEQMTDEVSPFASKSRLWSWVAKGLVMRRHPLGTSMCVDFCNVVLSPDHSDKEKAAAVRCIHVVVSDSRMCLNASCDVRSSSFFKHTLFRRVTPMLLEAVSLRVANPSPSSAHHYLLQLMMTLVTHCPTTVVRSSLDRLLPVVVMALTSTSSMLQETSLPAVAMVLSNNVEALAPHAESCCRNLLALCSVESATATCISALKCLSLMRGLPSEDVVRIQDDIVGGLWTTLDHPSRLVRKAAVVCRNQWFIVN